MVVAGVLGAVLIPAALSLSHRGFLCPDDTDTIELPAACAADNTPTLAGTVRVDAGTTLLNLVDTSPSTPSAPVPASSCVVYEL